jgi:ribosomal protein S18 acetylase RimI-like enzyme
VLGAQDLFDGPLRLASVRRYLEDRRNIVLVACEGPRVIGFLRGTALDQLESGRRQFFLYELAVADDRRRQGVGRALMERLLVLSRRLGHEEVFVFTDDPKNRAAHRLYRSTGGRTETRGERMYVYRWNGRRPGGRPARR